MTRFVVDASVAVKWFCRRTIPGPPGGFWGSALLSPDLVRAEVGNVMWKRWRRGEVWAESAGEALHDPELLPLRIEGSEPLMGTAWDVTSRYQGSFCDGLYVALAVQTGCAPVTADRRLYDTPIGSDLSEHPVWVEDAVPSTETKGGEL